MKWLFRILIASVIAVGVAAALAATMLYAPKAVAPHLSGRLSKGTLTLDSHLRTYLMYVPRHLPRNASLIMVLHGSDGNAQRVREATGYGFERLADKHGFAVVYPEAYEGNWNACNIRGNYSANQLNIDDVGFLTALADHLINLRGIDPHRVFAAGISRGGSMSYRLALEAPTHFHAIAAVAASLPAWQNFKCRPVSGAASVMIMNGTADPLNPFEGGEVSLLGMYRRGRVISSHDSAEYFARRNGITASPQLRSGITASGVRVETSRWRNGSIEVELVAIGGGGHGIPQPWSRHAGLLGPSPTEPNGPEMIVDFFGRLPTEAELGSASSIGHRP
jgi:polyhydroxybutyrate depolymerase